MDAHNVIVIARKELADSFRNRWFQLYTAAFTLLALAVSFMALVGTGSEGLAGYGRTTAGLVNLVSLIVPLMALTVGAVNIAGERERGTLGYLLAQPVGRAEVLLGKFVGLGAALLASLTAGFGISAAAVSLAGGQAHAMGYVLMAALAFVLGLAMLSVGLLISCLARKAAVAAGAAIFLWLALAFLSDLGLMGSSVIFKFQVQQLFALSLLNPLQVFKMAVLSNIYATLDVLGPAGLYATRAFEGWLGLIFAGCLAAWIVVPLALSMVQFTRSDQR